MCDVKKFLINNNFFNEFKFEFLEFTFKEFNRKLNEMDDEFKPRYYEKIKLFLSSLDFSAYELNNISFYYLVCYIHFMISADYNEFKLMQDNYDGYINLKDLNINQNFILKDYLFILENKSAFLVKYSKEMRYYLNYFKQKEASDKKLINNIYPNSEELMHLNDRVKYLKQQNDKLTSENLELKKQLNENIISKHVKKVFRK